MKKLFVVCPPYLHRVGEGGAERRLLDAREACWLGGGERGRKKDALA